MVKCVTIFRLGNIETKEVTSADNLYRKCKFRKKKGFEKIHSWIILMNKQKIFLNLFGKDEGRHQSINKYELPPPVDKKLFYGCLGIVASKDKEIKVLIDLTKEMWEKIYEKLMGGFEDLDNEEEDSEEDYIPPQFKTKQGYSKEDNFIVDDDDITYNTSSTAASEDEFVFSEQETPSDDNSSNEDQKEDYQKAETDNSDKNSKDDNSNADESANGDSELGDDELSEPGSELSEEEYICEKK